MITVGILWILWLVSRPIWLGMSTVRGVAPPPDWFKKANPFVLVYAPYAWPGYVSMADVAIFVAVLLLISTALLVVTIATIRRRVLEPARRVRPVSVFDRLGISRWLAWLPGPSLDGNPVLWREWRRNRPTRLARIMWLMYVIGSVAGAVVGIREAIAFGVATPSGSIVPNAVLLLQFVFGLMIVSCMAPASLAEERVRGSLDVLMTTPLSTESILCAKWLGTFRIVLWLAVLPGLTTVILAFMAPRFIAVGGVSATPEPLGVVDRLVAPCLIVVQMLSYGAAITSVGLALATWVPRLGRAIAINMAIFVLITIGWPVFFEAAIWYPMQEWLNTQSNTGSRWLVSAMMAISPFGAAHRHSPGSPRF